MSLGEALGGFALSDMVARVRIDTSDIRRAESETSGLGSTLTGAFAIGAAAVAAGGAAITAFAHTSIDRYKEVGSETRQLMSLTGGTAESMSRLRFAAGEVGISTDELGTAIKRLSTGIETNNKNVVNSGIAFKDAHGQVLPVDQLLGNVAAKFESMPNGVAKNTLAVQLFGKAGTDLIPFLNKGREGLAELEKQADKYGLTLSQSNLDALKKNSLAHKEFSAALEGLELQFGVHLLPTINKFVELGTKYLIPVITEATHVLDLILTPALRVVGDIFDKYVGPSIQTVARYLDGEGTEAWRVLAGVFQDNVEPVIRRVTSYVSDEMSQAWSWLKTFFQNDVMPGLQSFTDFMTSNAQPVLHAIGDYVKTDLMPNFRGVWDDATSALQGFWDLLKKVLPDFKAIGDGISKVVNSGPVSGVIDGVKGALGIGGSPSHSSAAGGTSGDTKKSGILGGVGGIAGAAGIGLTALSVFDPFKNLVKGAKDLTSTNLGEFLDGAKAKVGGLIPGFLRLGGAAEGAGASLSIMNVPVVVIVGALAALAAGAIYAYTHFKGFREGVNSVASAISGAFSNSVKWVVDHWPQISATATKVFREISTVAVPILRSVGTFIGNIVGSIVGFFKSHWAEITQVTRVAFTVIKLFVLAHLEIVWLQIRYTLGVIKVAWSLFHDDILNVVKGAWTIFTTIIETNLKIVFDIIGIALDLITGHWGKAWNDIKGLFSDAWDGIKGILSGSWDIIKGIFGAAFDVIKHIWNAGWGAVKDFLGWIWDGIKSAVSGAIDAVVGFFWGLGDRIKANIVDPLGMLKGVGRDIVTGLKQGIEDAWHVVTDKLGDLLSSLPAAAKKLLGISSPSKVFMEIGKEVPAGFAVGIDSGAGRVKSSMANLVQIPRVSYGGAVSTTTNTVKREYTANFYNTVVDPNEVGRTLRRMEMAYG